MAFANDIRHIEVGILAKFRDLREMLADRITRRRVFRTTVSELSNLSSRELNDLGINPSQIRAIAFEAAYGK